MFRKELSECLKRVTQLKHFMYCAVCAGETAEVFLSCLVCTLKETMISAGVFISVKFIVH